MEETAETFEEWKKSMREICNRADVSWNVEGDWLYPAAHNTAYHGVLSHLCREHQIASPRMDYSIDKCRYCGEEPPAGIKMLALLEML